MGCGLRFKRLFFIQFCIHHSVSASRCRILHYRNFKLLPYFALYYVLGAFQTNVAFLSKQSKDHKCHLPSHCFCVIIVLLRFSSLCEAGKTHPHAPMTRRYNCPQRCINENRRDFCRVINAFDKYTRHSF